MPGSCEGPLCRTHRLSESVEEHRYFFIFPASDRDLTGSLMMSVDNKPLQNSQYLLLYHLRTPSVSPVALQLLQTSVNVTFSH